MMISGQKATRTRKRLKNEAKRRANNARKRGARVEKSPHIRDDPGPPQPSPMMDFVLKKGGRGRGAAGHASSGPRAAATRATAPAAAAQRPRRRRGLTEEEKAARRAAVLERPLTYRKRLLWHVRAERDYWIRRNAEYLRRRAAGKPNMHLPMMELPCFFCGATIWTRYIQECVCKAGPCWYRRRDQYNHAYNTHPDKMAARREYQRRRARDPEKSRHDAERRRRYEATPARRAARKIYFKEYRNRPGNREKHILSCRANYARIKADPVLKAAAKKKRHDAYASLTPEQKARRRALNNKWRKNNPEKIKASQKKYVANNLEKIRAKEREYNRSPARRARVRAWDRARRRNDPPDAPWRVAVREGRRRRREADPEGTARAEARYKAARNTKRWAVLLINAEEPEVQGHVGIMVDWSSRSHPRVVPAP